MDAVVTRVGGAPLLLHNIAEAGNHWLGLRLTGSRSNRDAIGARVHISTNSGEQWNHVTTAVGYASSSDRAVHFGLGKDASVKSIEIIWPSGTSQRLKNVRADRYVDVVEP